MSNGSTILGVKDLKKIYSRWRKSPVVALDGIEFWIDNGQIVGLLGPNGAGKTTTIKCICGLIRPTQGKIWVGGDEITHDPRAGIQHISAVLEGNRNIYWRLTTRENLEFFAGLHGISRWTIRKRVDELIERFRLGEKEKTQARDLSRGMQQKLALACCLIKGTPILILDEPTMGLDVESSFELRELIRELALEEGKTVLLSSHNMNLVKNVCERVIIISKGRIVTDDRIENLIDLFKVKAYKFNLIGHLSENQSEMMRRRFPTLRLSATDHETTIEAEFAESAAFYEFIDILRSNSRIEIESMERQEPDFEEIYLKLVKGSE